MRLIALGTSSTPHSLAKSLVKPHSGTLGIISDFHLMNSNDHVVDFRITGAEIKSCQVLM